VAWSGRPDLRSYIRRLVVPAGVASLASLVIGAALLWLSFGDASLFVYPLVGALGVALGVYGLLVRPVLVAHAAREVNYRIDERGVELRWSRDRALVIPGSHLPPFTVVPSTGSGRFSDVLFAGPPAWEGPWGVWRIVDDTWGLVCLEHPEEAVAALRQLQAASPTPAAWAAGVATPPQTSVFTRALRGLVHRTPSTSG
jgi:hypothetical protein